MITPLQTHTHRGNRFYFCTLIFHKLRISNIRYVALWGNWNTQERLKHYLIRYDRYLSILRVVILSKQVHMLPVTLWKVPRYVLRVCFQSLCNSKCLNDECFESLIWIKDMPLVHLFVQNNHFFSFLMCFGLPEICTSVILCYARTGSDLLDLLSLNN